MAKASTVSGPPLTPPLVPHPQKALAVFLSPTGEPVEGGSGLGSGTDTGVTGLGPARSSGLAGMVLSESWIWAVTHLVGVCVAGELCDSWP